MATSSIPTGDGNTEREIPMVPSNEPSGFQYLHSNSDTGRATLRNRRDHGVVEVPIETAPSRLTDLKRSIEGARRARVSTTEVGVNDDGTPQVVVGPVVRPEMDSAAFLAYTMSSRPALGTGEIPVVPLHRPSGYEVIDSDQGSRSVTLRNRTNGSIVNITHHETGVESQSRLGIEMQGPSLGR